MSTGYVWHELCDWADSDGGPFPAGPSAGLQPIGHLERIEPRRATEGEGLRVHTPEVPPRPPA